MYTLTMDQNARRGEHLQYNRETLICYRVSAIPQRKSLECSIGIAARDLRQGEIILYEPWGNTADVFVGAADHQHGEDDAGSELDALVAEKVMGAQCVCGRSSHMEYQCPFHGWAHYRRPFSTDIAAAWEVVENMIQSGFLFDLRLSDGDGWVCEFYRTEWCANENPHSRIEVRKAPTAHLAICRAALKVVEGKKGA